MGKSWRDRQRRGVQASSGKTAVVSKENFTAPTSGLEKLTFSRGTMRDAEIFKDTLDKFAQHVGTWHMYGAANSVKAMKDMAEPVFTQPVHTPRKYYEFRTNQQISDQEPMVKTSDRFTNEHLNTKLVNDAKWKLDLDLFMVVQKKYEKDRDACIKNKAWTYNLVLQHCPPDIEVELKNQSTWTAGKDEQNVVTLLLMIRNTTHNMSEIKQSVMAIIDCAVQKKTTAHQSSETTEDYFDIFETQRNTVNTHNG